MIEQKRYENLDGFRSIAAISIVLLHVMVNIDYSVGSNIFTEIISIFGNFVQLFFIISGFVLCCGYYKKIKNNELDLNTFYKKRYIKILPFFSLLVLIDVVVSIVLNNFSLSTIIEALSDISLVFGFFPNSNIEVIGVGWTLGVIFGFYLLFPFFIFLLWTKKRSWISLVISIIIYYFCTCYFTVDGAAIRCNTISWFAYFISGGILYLYKDEVKKILNYKKFIRYISLIFCVLLTVLWFITPNEINNFSISIFKTLIMFTSWICYSISFKSIILSNKVTKFISSISFEIYLSHMMFFRIVEKLKLTHLSNSNAVSYIITFIIVLLCTILFAHTFKVISSFIGEKIVKGNQNESIISK